MTQRDDDPVHPNWHGMCFVPSTDRKGVIAMPESAQVAPPYTYLPLGRAKDILSDIRAVIYGIESFDARSYLAHFLNEMSDDLADAISACDPEFEKRNAPSSTGQGPAA